MRDEFPHIPLPKPGEFERGGIVGQARIVDVVRQMDSPWFFGPIGLVMTEAKPLPFQPCKGALGFFNPSAIMPTERAAASTREPAMTRPRIYLAGPDVFRRDAFARGEELKRMCAAYDVEGLYPLDCCPLQDSDDIRRQCIAMILSADAVVADISPFRGKHMDPGTAWEIGYAEAIGKPVFLWSSDTRPMVERIPGVLDIDHGVKIRDAEGLLIEDHGKPENLMIASSRSFVYTRPEQAIDQAAGMIEAQAATKASIKAGMSRLRAVALAMLALVVATMVLIAYARADIYVIDGDTIVVDREHIRLIGLDAPETRNAQCDDELRRGLDAKARLINELTAACGPLAKAPASCLGIARLPQHDRYNRSLAAVTVRGRDVAATLIAAGLARPYVCGEHCPKRRSWCGG